MKLIRTIVLMLIAAGVAIVADRTYRARTNPSSAECIEDAKFDKIVIDHLQFDHEPLANALRKLSDKGGVGIVLDLSSLQRVGFTPDAPVSAMFDRVSLSEALNQTLRSLQPQFPTKLDYTLERGSIFVTTEYDINDHPMLRVYDIDAIASAMLAHQVAVEPYSLPKPGDPPGVLFQNANTAGPVTDQDVVDSIVRLLEEVVATNSWRDNGGVAGSITEVNHRLFIQQTWRNQQEIARFIQQLREATAASPAQRGSK